MARQLNRPRRLGRFMLTHRRPLQRRLTTAVDRRLPGRPIPTAIISREYRNPDPNPTYTFVPRYCLPGHLSADELIGRGQDEV